MKLYVMQHAEALSKEADPARPLSAQGEKDAAAMANWLKSQSPQLGRIVHSGKRRAEQTAALVAGIVAPGLAIGEQPGLAPNDDVGHFVAVLAAWNEDSLVVGHLPFVARLVGALLVCSEPQTHLAFRPGTLACLESSPDQMWQLLWMVRPELARMT